MALLERILEKEHFRLLALALRRVASLDEEDAERFLLFVPRPPVTSGSGLVKLAAAAVVSTIVTATSQTLAHTLSQKWPAGLPPSRDRLYWLALVFSRDYFERATGLVALLAETAFEGDPDEIALLALGSIGALENLRVYFQELALRIDEMRPTNCDPEHEDPAPAEPPPKPAPSVRARPAKDRPSPTTGPVADLNAAIEAVLAATASKRSSPTEWRLKKAAQVLVWAAAKASGRVNRDLAKELFESEGLVFVPPDRLG